MNKYQGHIVKVESSGALSMISVALSDGVEVSAIVIETPESASYLKEGGPISVLFKETEVILSNGNVAQIGIKNRVPGEVQKIEADVLLSKVTLQTPMGELEVIIASTELKSLGLLPGDPVTALIKINEVMLMAL
jgi:molybdopterin-binding protein